MKQLRELAKGNNAPEAYIQLCKNYNFTDLSDFQKEDAAWIIFYYIKNADLDQVKDALSKYLEINPPKPSMVHSNILRLLGKKSETIADMDLPGILSDIGLFFRDEDYNATLFQGKQIPPLFDSVICDCFDHGMEFEVALGEFKIPNKSVQEQASKILTLYGSCIYRKLWKYNSEEDDEIKSYQLVREYLNETEGYSRKGEMHSKILNSLIWDTHDETSGWFQEVFEKWGMDSFRDEDWKKIRRGDETYDSLAEKAIGKYIKALRINNASPSNDFEALIGEALNYYPEDETFLRYSAKYCIRNNDPEGAIRKYRKMILAGNKYYLWSELAAIIEDHNNKMGCLSKAILLQKDNNFLGTVRLSFAKLLIDKEMYAEAATELKIYENTYSANNWGLKSHFYELKKKLPADVSPNENNLNLYREYQKYADQFIYEEFPIEVLVVTGKKEKIIEGKRKSRLMLLSHKGDTFSINPRAFGLKGNLERGSIVNARIFDTGADRRVVWASSGDTLPLLPAEVDNVNTLKGRFHFSGDAVSGSGRLDKCNFTPQPGDRVLVMQFLIEKPNGERFQRVIQITRG